MWKTQRLGLKGALDDVSGLAPFRVRILSSLATAEAQIENKSLKTQ
jgi:hypothetical protein